MHIDKLPLHPLNILQKQFECWSFHNPTGLMKPVLGLLHPGTIPCLALLVDDQATTTNNNNNY